MSSTAIPQPIPAGLLAVVSFFRLTVDEYHEMIRNNILTTDDRVELLDGYLVNKMPQNIPHRTSVLRLTTRLAPRLPAGWVVMTQMPVTLPSSVPEPDGAVVRGTDATYDARNPTVADFGIVIEVSDSSLALDRGLKAGLYARSGLPEYWIVNIVDKQIEVYTDPDTAAEPPAYRTRTDYKPGDAVPVTLDGQVVGTIPASELLP
jgi:Uma2 family endonuclease